MRALESQCQAGDTCPEDIKKNADETCERTFNGKGGLGIMKLKAERKSVVRTSKGSVEK